MEFTNLTNFCSPALFFLVIIFFDILFIVFGKSKDVSKSFYKKIKTFIILSLCGFGWSIIINSACDYEQNIAWGLATIPLLYLSFK